MQYNQFAVDAGTSDTKCHRSRRWDSNPRRCDCLSQPSSTHPTAATTDVKTPHVTDNGHHSPLPSCLCTPNYLTKHTWRRHTRLRHTHNSVGSALHAHRRDPDTRIQVGHMTNTQSQYTLQFNTQVRHVRSVRALGPEGPSRVLKLPVSRDAPAHSITTHGAGTSQPTQDRALGSILYFIPQLFISSIVALTWEKYHSKYTSNQALIYICKW